MKDADDIRQVVLKVFQNWSDRKPSANDGLYRAGDQSVLFDVTPLQDIGWENQKRRLTELFAGFSDFEMSPNADVDVHHLGDVAWVTCTWTASIHLKVGDARRLIGRATMILERHEQQWFVVHDHVSVPMGSD